MKKTKKVINELITEVLPKCRNMEDGWKYLKQQARKSGFSDNSYIKKSAKDPTQLKIILVHWMENNTSMAFDIF